MSTPIEPDQLSVLNHNCEGIFKPVTVGMLNDKNQQFRPWPLSSCWDRKGKTIKEGRGSPVVKISSSNAEGTGSIPSLGTKIPMPHTQKTKAQKRSDTVTNPIKTLKKWCTHTQKKLKKEKKRRKRSEVRI